MNVLRGTTTVPCGPRAQTHGRRTLALVWKDLKTTTQKGPDEPVKVGKNDTTCIFTANTWSPDAHTVFYSWRHNLDATHILNRQSCVGPLEVCRCYRCHHSSIWKLSHLSAFGRLQGRFHRCSWLFLAVHHCCPNKHQSCHRNHLHCPKNCPRCPYGGHLGPVQGGCHHCVGCQGVPPEHRCKRELSLSGLAGMWRQRRQLYSCPADCGLDRVRHQACSCEFYTPWLVKLGVDWCFLKLRRILMLPLLERKPLHGIGDPLQQHGSERPTQWSDGDPKNTPGGSHHVRLWEEHDHFCWLWLHGVPFVSCCLRALHYFYTQCQFWD